MRKFVILLISLLLVSCKKDDLIVEEDVKEYYSWSYVLESLNHISEYKIIDKKTNKIFKDISRPINTIKYFESQGKVYLISQVFDKIDVYTGQEFRLIIPFEGSYENSTALEISIRQINSDSSIIKAYGKVSNKEEFFVDFKIMP